MAFSATVVTLFPEMFPGPLGLSLAGKAMEAGSWSLETVGLREFGVGKHRMVDDTPAGGGAGMVLRADVLAAPMREASARRKSSRPTCRSSPPRPTSPHATVVSGTGRPTNDDANATQIARSAPGSTTRTPPTAIA